MTKLDNIVLQSQESKPFKIEFVDDRTMSFPYYHRTCVEVNFINHDEHGLDNRDNYSKGFKIIEKPRGYSMSYVDEHSKSSRWYYDCVGILVNGYSQALEKQLSSLTHFYPGSFINSNSGNGFPLMHEFSSFFDFKKNLVENLDVLNDKSQKDFISGVIFAGNIYPNHIVAGKVYSKIVSELMVNFEDKLGVSPYLVKPKFANGIPTHKGIDAYFSSHENTLFLTNSTQEILTKKEEIYSFLEKL